MATQGEKLLGALRWAEAGVAKTDGVILSCAKFILLGLAFQKRHTMSSLLLRMLSCGFIVIRRLSFPLTAFLAETCTRHRDVRPQSLLSSRTT